MKLNYTYTVRQIEIDLYLFHLKKAAIFIENFSPRCKCTSMYILNRFTLYILHCKIYQMNEFSFRTKCLSENALIFSQIDVSDFAHILHIDCE